MSASTVDTQTLVLIPACALAAPLLADRLQRRLAVPTVVFEIVLGVLIGPDVLGWAKVDDFTGALSQFGLAMLMFLAGYEIDLGRLRGGPLKRAGAAWLVSLVLALGFGALVNRDPLNGAFAGLALTTTALGTILPILRDAGDLPTPFGSMAMATGAVGEFGPIIAIAVLLSGNTPLRTAVILAAFAAITTIAVAYARRPRPDWTTRLIRRTLRSRPAPPPERDRLLPGTEAHLQVVVRTRLMAHLSRLAQFIAPLVVPPAAQITPAWRAASSKARTAGVVR